MSLVSLVLRRHPKGAVTVLASRAGGPQPTSGWTGFVDLGPEPDHRSGRDVCGKKTFHQRRDSPDPQRGKVGKASFGESYPEAHGSPQRGLLLQHCVEGSRPPRRRYCCSRAFVMKERIAPPARVSSDFLRKGRIRLESLILTKQFSYSVILGPIPSAWT